MNQQSQSPPEAAESEKERKKRYKQTLNLPQTDFPMRANLAQNEPQSQRRWTEGRLYDRILDARAHAAPFVFHDGPPYANGSIHVGHLLNKVLKDIVVRSRNLAGRRCHYVPGWDCHGLPIEHKVLTEMVASGRIEKLDGLAADVRRMAIRRECARAAAKYKDLQAKQMQRLSTLADYDNPYLTMQPGYEEAVLAVFADLLDQGLVYRDLKPVHWSIANQTALAEAELEYRDRQDPSITVRFDATDLAAVGAAFGVEGLTAAGFAIWTTTPWTIPANLLIAVHPEHRYALVELAGVPTVVARELAPAVAAAVGGEHRILGETRGEALLGLEYRHPFIARTGRLVAADYVTLEDGTGLVHTAPGHGQEDFETGQREGVAAYSPVRGDGTYDDTVPESLRGLTVWEANPRIIQTLRDSGHLLHHVEFEHSYPHDWRSKTPVIFRCTEQWFIAVDRPAHGHGQRSLRELALTAADDSIRFVPAWGKKRLRGMLESRPDWCISRQRAWGLPIPAFVRPDGSIFLTAASVRAVAEVFGSEGSDAWFTERPVDLLRQYDPAADPEAPPGLDVATLEKTYDIFDVWFESGSSWHAVMRRRMLGFPSDLYLEGSDQHRGWFQLSLLPALGATGKAPFSTLLTHGFMVDKAGKKMSKSLGNALEVDELLGQFGADVCRWWVSSLAFENDIKVDLSYFEVAGESYRKVRNTLRFMLSNLADYQAGDQTAPPSPTSLDAWVLRRAAELRSRVLEAYDQYELRHAHLLLFDFCNETLSALYLDAVKDRLYCDRPDSPRRRATQATLHRLTELLATLLAPILPHTADEVWRTLHGEEASVHLQTFTIVEASADDAGWALVMALRERAQKALEDSPIENKLDAGVRVADPDGSLAHFAADLPDVLGVSRVVLDPDAPQDTVEVLDLRDAPRCERSWRRDDTVSQRPDGGWLSQRDAEAVGLV